MRKFVYLCVLIFMGLNVMAQFKNSFNPYDTICSYLEKNLMFTYNPTQLPIVDGWIYNNTYSDEFNGQYLNTAKWEPLDHEYHPHNANLGYLEENVSISDGKLVLSAKYDNEAQWYNAFNNNVLPLNLNSGAIKSIQFIRYGYYEAEIYFPKSHHFRPCFWTVGGSSTEYDEIDILEIIEDDDTPYRFQQNEYSNLEKPGSSSVRQRLLSSDSITGKTLRLGVEVFPYEIVFYINGHVSSQLVYNDEYANLINIFTCTDITRTVPMHIEISFDLTPVNGGVPQPYEDCTVNYFRCYKLDRGSINTYNPVVFTPSAESCKVYPNIILGGNGHTASINTPTAVWAEQSIVFDKGFELSANTCFSARIINHGSENPATSPLYIANCPN